jgi:hypothetical protein
MIQLADGSMFALLAPDPERMSPGAIACGLANACRFGGQMRRYYSVTQHSVLVALLAPDALEVQRYALLHDAEEAFGLPDLPTPMKPFFPQFVEARVFGDGRPVDRGWLSAQAGFDLRGIG